jgi:hypothetical protein
MNGELDSSDGAQTKPVLDRSGPAAARAPATVGRAAPGRVALTAPRAYPVGVTLTRAIATTELLRRNSTRRYEGNDKQVSVAEHAAG